MAEMPEPNNVTAVPSRDHDGSLVENWSRHEKAAYVAALQKLIGGADGEGWRDWMENDRKGTELYKAYHRFTRPRETPAQTYERALRGDSSVAGPTPTDRGTAQDQPVSGPLGDDVEAVLRNSIGLAKTEALDRHTIKAIWADRDKRETFFSALADFRVTHRAKVLDYLTTNKALKKAFKAWTNAEEQQLGRQRSLVDGSGDITALVPGSVKGGKGKAKFRPSGSWLTSEEAEILRRDGTFEGEIVNDDAGFDVKRLALATNMIPRAVEKLDDLSFPDLKRTEKHHIFKALASPAYHQNAVMKIIQDRNNKSHRSFRAGFGEYLRKFEPRKVDAFSKLFELIDAD